MRNHYKEAKALVRTLSSELAVLKAKLSLTDDDFLSFLADEHAYLVSLKRPPERDEIKIRYVQVIDELEERR